jgi:hypothetical protein
MTKDILQPDDVLVGPSGVRLCFEFNANGSLSVGT